jgi:ankyrin repeat protein
VIPLWNDILNMFIQVDPGLKSMIAEKDYTFENNKETIRSILSSKQKHPKLLKFKGFIMSESFGYGTFATTLFSSCQDINIIKHILENSNDFKISDHNYDVFEVVCNYSTPDIVKYFISNGYNIMHNVNGRLIAITLMNNGSCADDEELNGMISESLKNTHLLDDGTPVIVYCVKRSTLGLIKVLVESGHDILSKDENGDNLLKIAANNNRDDSIIMYLLEQIHLKNKEIVEQPISNDGRTIVHWMLTAGYGKKPTVDTIKRLIQIGVNMEVMNPINNWRPIHYICRYCTTSVIFYVMGIGVNLTETCMHDGIETPPLALLDINGNIKDSDREQLLNEFFQFVELQNLTKN